MKMPIFYKSSSWYTQWKGWAIVIPTYHNSGISCYKYPCVNLPKFFDLGLGIPKLKFLGLGQGTVWLWGKESGKERNGIVRFVPLRFTTTFVRGVLHRCLAIFSRSMCTFQELPSNDVGFLYALPNQQIPCGLWIACAIATCEGGADCWLTSGCFQY